MSIHLLAALACELDLDLCHFDAEQAFVPSDLDEVVYIRLPSIRFEASFANAALSCGQRDEGSWV